MHITQAELEERMYQAGRERAAEMFAKAEEGGRAADAPYAQRVYRTYVLPLAAHLKEEVEKPRVGRSTAHVVLLRGLDLEAVAFLSVRHIINTMMEPGEAPNHRTVAYGVGRTIHRELVLSQIAEQAPDLYHTLANDFGRRMSKDERHRMTVFMMQAKQAGLDIRQWGVGARDQVGLYLLGRLEDLGLVGIDPVVRARALHPYRGVYLTPEVLSSIDAIKTYISETTPIYGPCIEPPLEWHGLSGGGFHTEKMQRSHRYLVKAPPTARDYLRRADLSTACAAVNTLQETRWAVNREVADVIAALAAAGREVAGIALPTDEPRPDRAPWMDDTDKAAMTPEQGVQLKAWKRAMSEWYERRKRRVAGYSRFYSASRQASFFRDLGPLYFVYFLDTRGRAYPLTYGLSPQGDDLQKGLLRFYDGLPLDSDDAVRWFLIHGANKFGFDKAKLAEREQWVRERDTLIRNIAANPLDTVAEWAAADNPVQFLAWCLEYAEWRRGGEFVSHLPISMDGSCNGLQHFSAMLRDEVGGEATNLTNNESMQDIYGRVADAAFLRIVADVPKTDEDRAAQAWWIAHGVSRTVVKRSVMTTPYGVTKRTSTKYVLQDYLSTVPNIDGEYSERYRLAAYVMDHVWPAIGDVVVKAKEAMDWLKAAVPAIIAEKTGEDDPMIEWETPDGFPATQTYFEMTIHEIRSLLHGKVRINVAAETDTPALARHQTALAPNFVHSMDATHMRLVTAAAKREGITSLAMIHDDYGTHAANAGRLFRIIREQFFEMYSNHDPLRAFSVRYPTSGAPPLPGTLDLGEVLESDYFFS
jgi:DNA-directed RNA polymerase